MSRIRLSKIATPTNPPASALEVFYNTATSKLSAVDENGNVISLGGFTGTTNDFRLIRVYMPPATGSYTPTTGTRAIYFEGVGAGGGGGGVSGAASNAAAGGGGAGGGYSAAWITTLNAPYAITIGGGGPGGVAGANYGTAGGQTWILDASSNYVICAYSGQGGYGMPAGTTVGSAYGGSPGWALSHAAVGDMISYGSGGAMGFRVSGTLAIAGIGGAACFPGSGPARTQGQNVNTVLSGAGGAIPGGGGGSGGSGAACVDGNSYAGGNGGNGLVRIWEYA
jgi:hypothetical protein